MVLYYGYDLPDSIGTLQRFPEDDIHAAAVWVWPDRIEAVWRLAHFIDADNGRDLSRPRD